MKPAALHPDLSKAARRELGLSQNDVIKATGMQAYRLKQYESRGLTIDMADLRKLCEFYEAQGVDLDELAGHIGQAPRTVLAEPNKLPGGFTNAPKPGFTFSDKVAADEQDRLIMRAEENDDRIGDLVKAKIERGGFGSDITEESQAQIQELFGAMAENYLIYRLLQGRNVIEAMRPVKEARTVGEFVSQWLKESPIAADFALIDEADEQE